MKNEKSLNSQNGENREKLELQKLKADILQAVLEISSENESISEKLKNKVEEIFQKQESSLASDDYEVEESDKDFVGKYFNIYSSNEDDNDPNKLETLVQEVEKTIGSISSNSQSKSSISMYPHSEKIEEKIEDTLENLVTPKPKTQKKNTTNSTAAKISTAKKTASMRKSTKTKKSVSEEVISKSVPEDILKPVKARMEAKPIVDAPVVEKAESVAEAPAVAEVEPVAEAPAVAETEPVAEAPAVAETKPVNEEPKAAKEKPKSSFSKPSPHIASFLKPKTEAPKAELPKTEAPKISTPVTAVPPFAVQKNTTNVKETKKDIPDNFISAHKATTSEINSTQKPVDLSQVVIDENCTDPIGGVFGLDDEKPLTGSFTLSEQLEDNTEKNVDDLDVPLGGSFGVEPSEVTVSGKFVENTKPVVTMVEDMTAPASTPSVAPITSNDGQIVENLVSAHKSGDSQINSTQKPVDLSQVVIDENCTDPIGGVFGLDDEKPLTGSFTLNETIEDNSNKSADDLDVPLEGSFDVEPATVTVSGKFVENTKPVVTKVDNSPLISFEENEKFDMDDITAAILNVAKNNANKGVSSAKFAEQVKKLLKKNK